MGPKLGLQDKSAYNRLNYHATIDILQELKGLGCIQITRNTLKHSGYYGRYMYRSETLQSRQLFHSIVKIVYIYTRQTYCKLVTSL